MAKKKTSEVEPTGSIFFDEHRGMDPRGIAGLSDEELRKLQAECIQTPRNMAVINYQGVKEGVICPDDFTHR